MVRRTSKVQPQICSRFRRRADELVQRLGVRFPVYLVFTKCDMLQGFVEFFGEMTRREREQIWGVRCGVA